MQALNDNAGLDNDGPRIYVVWLIDILEPDFKQ